jgi:hypothetical protein
MIPAHPVSISIVTPSYNQAEFLPAALDSVLGQNYPNLEYIVLDGGSTDGSVEIIERYADRLDYWTSGRDGGHFPAVTKGFARATGEVVAWLNSDDYYCPWALSVVGEIFTRYPQIEWLTTTRPLLLDRAGRAVHCEPVPGYARSAFLDREHCPGAGGYGLGYIQQESTFWRRSLWEKAGRFDVEYPLANDLVLWARFFEHAELYGVTVPLGGFRTHGEQKTGRDFAGYLTESERFLSSLGARKPSPFWKHVRELAVRAPAALHPTLAGTGAMHRANLVTYDLAARDWKIEERFV